MYFLHTFVALYFAWGSYEMLTGQPPWQRDEDEDLDSGLAKMKVSSIISKIAVAIFFILTY